MTKAFLPDSLVAQLRKRSFLHIRTPVDYRGQMTSSRKTILRLAVVAILAVPSVAISVSASSAAPSKAQVEAAKAKLDDLNRQLDQLIE